jgi:seryl-tRNA synthetase
MPNRFWIESIHYSGEDVRTTTVEFKPGFNIVHGPSDTGKTYLAKTIKYMLAGATSPFPAETGYTRITMTLRTSEGKIKLTRTIGSTKTTVSADHVFGIPHDEYAAQPTESNMNEMTVSDILLRLIGIDERRVVLTNQYGSRKPLTWKTFADTLHRSEGRITSEESIFSTAKYTTLSAFITLFYDQDLSLLPEHDDPAILKTRKDILVPRLDERLRTIENRLAFLQDEFLKTGTRDVSEELALLSDQLTALNQTQDAARAQLAQVTKRITDTEQELAVRSMSSRRYDDLASVYVGNIKRLTFVTDAQTAIEDIETPATCPFCDNPLPATEDIDYRQAAQAEAETIAQDLEELSTVRATLDQHLNHLHQRLEDLQEQQRAIERQLADAVLLQIAELRQQIQPLEQHQAAVTEYRMLEAEHDDLQEQLTDLLNPIEPSNEYDPTAHFPSAFYTEMTRYLQEILTETQFAGAQQAIFDSADFDIKIGHRAKRSHGKGYRAFFNTIVVLALRRYIHEHATHKPPIVVLDTPTLGLEHQKSGAGLVTSRDEHGRPKTGLLRNLYDHMVDTGQYGQIIILNNTDVTPTTHFDGEDTTELIFGEHEAADRLGLLIDIKEGSPDMMESAVEQPRLWD